MIGPYKDQIQKNKKEINKIFGRVVSQSELNGSEDSGEAEKCVIIPLQKRFCF